MATTLILGRDGMGDADESDFDAWTAYVAEHIDLRCGFEVTVEQRERRDVQTDAVRAASEDDEQTVREALAALWESWCAEGAPGVEASEGAAEPAIIEITDGPETMDGYRADLAADWQTYIDAAISALHPDAEVRIIWSADATRIHARAFVSGDERGASAASVALREAVQSQCEDAWDQWCLTVGGAS